MIWAYNWIILQKECGFLSIFGNLLSKFVATSPQCRYRLFMPWFMAAINSLSSAKMFGLWFHSKLDFTHTHLYICMYLSHDCFGWPETINYNFKKEEFNEKLIKGKQPTCLKLMWALQTEKKSQNGRIFQLKINICSMFIKYRNTLQLLILTHKSM